METINNEPKTLIEGLFITAFEGGSNYWAEMRIRLKPTNLHLSESERIFNAIMRGNEFRVFDCENPREVLGTVDRAKLEKGLRLMKKEYREHYNDVITEQWDATTADVFFQLAVLNELTFG